MPSKWQRSRQISFSVLHRRLLRERLPPRDNAVYQSDDTHPAYCVYCNRSTALPMKSVTGYSSHDSTPRPMNGAACMSESVSIADDS